MPRRTLVLADLHLTRQTPKSVTRDLEHFLRTYAGERVIFAGDLLDLSAELPRAARDRAIDEGLAAHPEVRAALGHHVDAGGELWLAGGNHDAEIGLYGFEDALAKTLAIPTHARPRVRTTPWFFREGGLHVEHGHLYDPDNAPAHPLASSTSLGVLFTEEFIATTGAHKYLNANDGKPLGLFLSAFRWYGVRAPYVVYRFFCTAFSALAKSGRAFPAASDWDTGEAQLVPFAEKMGVSRELASHVRDHRATPTLASTRDTFARLYLDRVLGTVAILGGGGALMAGNAAVGGAAMAAGAMLLGASWARGHDRYGGHVTERLAKSASRIVASTDAKLVVFGHTHREALTGEYANTGSFSFPRGAPGRPFLEIGGKGHAPIAMRRYLNDGAILDA